jgi:NAD kinase
MGFTPAIVIVTRETRLARLKQRWVTDRQARFYLAQAHEHERALRQARMDSRAATVAEPEVAAEAEFDQYVSEDQQYQHTLARLERDLQMGFPVRVIDRELVPTFDFWSAAAVVVVGQDGLVANTAKYAAELPIIGINPDPSRFDGVLLPFQASQARNVLRRVLDKKARLRKVTLAEVELNDGQKLLAFNDLFIGCASHISARYTLEVNGQSEPQSSSGIIVSTGAGSTGWMSSVFNMAAGIARLTGAPPPEPIRLAWEDRRLLWAVREPFQSRHSEANLVAGLLEEGDELIVESLMPERGVIFSDGIESDYLAFASGTIARIRASHQHAQLVVA